MLQMAKKMSGNLLSAGIAETLQIVLGERITDFRKKSGRTQARLAHEVGISRAALANIEVGRQRMSVPMLVRLAECLGAPINELVPSLHDVGTRIQQRELPASATPSPKLEQELAKYNYSMKPPGSIDRALQKIAPSAKKEKPQ